MRSEQRVDLVFETLVGKLLCHAQNNAIVAMNEDFIWQNVTSFVKGAENRKVCYNKQHV